MNSMELGILLIMVYIGVYGIVNRICSCFEMCSMQKYKTTQTEKIQ